MGKSAPDYPDPAETAAAQGMWNTFTAQQQQQMNMINQVSPWGTLTYDQTGSTWMTDPSGNRVEVPLFTATTKLSDTQQKLYDTTQQTQKNLADIAKGQSAWLQDYLAKPFEYNNQDVENWIYDLASKRILPQQEQNRKALENQLINRGIRPGTAAWDSEMQRLTQANTDQMNQLALAGRSQAFNEAMAMRNQPLNEIIGLMSGSQVVNPTQTFAQTPQTQVGGVNYSDLVNNKYQAELAAYNAQTGALGGLFGSAMSLFSDERLKEDIEPVGETYEGQTIYKYRYKDGGPTQMGVMAQESDPEAVSVDPFSGFLMVDYDKVK